MIVSKAYSLKMRNIPTSVSFKNLSVESPPFVSLCVRKLKRSYHLHLQRNRYTNVGLRED